MGKAEKHIDKFRNSNNLFNPFKNRVVNFREIIDYSNSKDKLLNIMNNKKKK